MCNSLIGLSDASEKATEDCMTKRHDLCSTLPTGKRRVHGLILADPVEKSASNSTEEKYAPEIQILFLRRRFRS